LHGRSDDEFLIEQFPMDEFLMDEFSMIQLSINHNVDQIVIKL